MIGIRNESQKDPHSMENTALLKNRRKSILVKIPVSIGELVDKATILSIKAKEIKDSDKLSHIRKELNLLLNATKQVEVDTDSKEVKALTNINLKLWNLENAIRGKEKKAQFDKEFIELARAIYQLNDKRTMLKRRISLKYDSGLIEEKEYRIS